MELSSYALQVLNPMASSPLGTYSESYTSNRNHNSNMLTQEMRALESDGRVSSNLPKKRKRGAPATTSTPAEPARRRKKSAPTVKPVASSKPKKKPAPARYTCTTCGAEKSSASFPNYTPSATCQHTIHTCKVCLKTWVNTQIADASFVTRDASDNPVFGLHCPECPEIMVNPDIQRSTTENMHYRFAQREQKHIKDNTPGWRWCMSPKCSAGQIHKNGMICTCKECGARACVPCDRPYHDGETCSAYKQRVTQEGNEKSVATIDKTTKPCPQCQVKIQKDGGCDRMICKFKFDGGLEAKANSLAGRCGFRFYW